LIFFLNKLRNFATNISDIRFKKNNQRSHKMENLPNPFKSGDFEAARSICNQADKIKPSWFVDACKRGHIEIAKMIIQKTSDTKLSSWKLDVAVTIAQKRGHTQIVELLLNFGAKYSLKWACYLGMRDIIDHVLVTNEESCNYTNRMIEEGFQWACAAGRQEIAEYMILKGAQNLNAGLEHACKNGRTDIINFLVTKGANDFDWGLAKACRHNHLNTAYKMFKLGARNFRRAFLFACGGGHYRMVKIMLRKLYNHTTEDLNTGFDFLYVNNREDCEVLKCMTYLIKKGVNRFTCFSRELRKKKIQHVLVYVVLVLRDRELYENIVDELTKKNYARPLTTVGWETEKIKEYLLNRRLLSGFFVKNHSNPTIFNVVSLFTCRDVAFFTTCFRELTWIDCVNKK